MAKRSTNINDFPDNALMLVKVCPYCGITFYTTRTTCKYCSDKCKEYFKRGYPVDAIVDYPHHLKLPLSRTWVLKKYIQLKSILKKEINYDKFKLEDSYTHLKCLSEFNETQLAEIASKLNLPVTPAWSEENFVEALNYIIHTALDLADDWEIANM